jgi:hypothetical protein
VGPTQAFSIACSAAALLPLLLLLLLLVVAAVLLLLGPAALLLLAAGGADWLVVLVREGMVLAPLVLAPKLLLLLVPAAADGVGCWASSATASGATPDAAEVAAALSDTVRFAGPASLLLAAAVAAAPLSTPCCCCCSGAFFLRLPSLLSHMNTDPSSVTTAVRFLPADKLTTLSPASGPATSKALGTGAADGQVSTTPSRVRHDVCAAPAVMATANGRITSVWPW